MDIPPQFAAQQAILRQNVALSMIKSTAQAERQIIGILEHSARTIAASNRGGNVNITA